MKAVIFDMDGVIIDSEPVHFRLETRMLSELGLNLPLEEHESFLGTSSYEFFETLKKRYLLSASVEALVTEERERYMEQLQSIELPLIPGIPELVRTLHTEGFPLAVASSAPHEQIDLVMTKSGLGHFFPVRISGDDVMRSKPDPGIFLKTAEALNTPPASCWVLEDSANGIAAARAAGMHAIAYCAPSAPSQDLSAAEAVVNSITEVRNLILNGS